eukprot:CAMPEP_0197634366 /NCGR_PEP_ID=MMETSP1338-20131121/10477_1 /TAXON_ID=43686 ORGANISM="Pelagodinium beii, Strain RCC1491" /NCGR_SAMPLE_ID=MMETSP1338 /ASSEMBLY_ACC=CAM_ASM_000754 /LENGTH=463 /DNA_ID=CAMNT_0043206219 /DNA_START=54 /DNA_END=1446 /DNA_ORIENTATION=-
MCKVDVVDEILHHAVLPCVKNESPECLLSPRTHELNAEEETDCQEETVRKFWHPSPAQLTAVLWILASSSMLMFNKQLLSGGIFPFPATLLLMHQTFLAVLLNGLLHIAPKSLLQSIMPGATEKFSCSDWLRSFLPLGVLQVVSMATQTMSLKLMSAHSVVMLSASKPLLVAAIRACAGLSPYNCLEIKVLLCVAAGVFVSAGLEASMTFEGFAYLMVAQVTESLRMVLMQKLLSAEARELDALTLISRSSPACMLLLVPLAYLEIRHVELSVLARPGFLSLAGSALLAFTLNVLGVQMIKVGSAMALMLLGILKDFLSIFLSVWFFSAELRPMQVLGYLFAIAFINIYRTLKANNPPPETSLVGLLWDLGESQTRIIGMSGKCKIMMLLGILGALVHMIAKIRMASVDSAWNVASISTHPMLKVDSSPSDVAPPDMRLQELDSRKHVITGHFMATHDILALV